MSFSRAELERFHGAGMTDLIAPGVRLLLVGVNPGLWSAAVDAPFARPGNRFWPALHRAGITTYAVEARAGLSAADRAHLAARRIGITNIVDRATARAAELTREELRAGAARLADKVAGLGPAVVAVLGITAHRTAFAAPAARLGVQPRRLGTAALWALPNPSGLNAHETVASLAGWYRQAAEAAGVPLGPAR